MPIKTSTDGESLAFLVGNVINLFNLGSKLVVITSYGGTNLEICKAILEITLHNTGVFDLENPMFVTECLAYLLDNACKAGVMDVKSDDVRVDTEATRRNMQHCITCTRKSQKGAKALETVQKNVGLPFKRLITPVKTRFAYIIQSFWYLI